MTVEHCPHCGAGLSDEGAPSVRASAPAVTSKYEALRELVDPPHSVADMAAKSERGGPTWWLPSLVYLAYRTADAEARAVLDEFASRRDELGYAVVEEQTDGVVGLTIQPWPLVDERGRLRFPISVDPVEVEVRADDLATLMRAERERCNQRGLLHPDLVGRTVHIGDAYALAVFDKPGKSRIPVLPHAEGDEPRYLGGLAARRRRGSVAVPILDITWDAREAGKLAHYAAAAGVVPDELGAAPAAVAAVAQETEARYMIGFERGVHPRDVPPGWDGRS